MHFDCDILFGLAGDVRRNSRALRQIRALRAEGHSVRVVCFSDRVAHETLPDVPIHPVPVPGPRGPRFFLQLHLAMRGIAESLAARAYHASDLFTLPAMAGAAKRRKSALVYDSRELYSGLASTRHRPWSGAFWSAVEHRYIGRASLVLTVNESIADHLVAQYGIGRPLSLPNVPVAQSVMPSGVLRVRASVSSDSPLVLYQGFLKPGRGCIPLLSAVRQVENCTLVFMGEGALRDDLERRARELEIEHRVRFLEMALPDELLGLTADADVGACLIEPLTESLRLSLPNKLFEYIAAGVPVLASPLPEIERIVCGYEVGLTASPADEGAIARSLRQMIDDAPARSRWSANCTRVLADFDSAEILRRFTDAYRGLLGGRTTSARP